MQRASSMLVPVKLVASQAIRLFHRRDHRQEIQIRQDDTRYREPRVPLVLEQVSVSISA